MKPRILLLEDDAATRFGFVRYYTQQGYEIRETANCAQAADAVAAERFDAIVVDITLPDGNGVDFIDTVRNHDPIVPIIIMTGAADIAVAVDAMRRGADNFITKPIDEISLAEFLKKNLELGVLKRQQQFRRQAESREDALFGEDPAMRKLLEFARIAAESDCPVLITGETGSGKGMLAKWIHRNSPRHQHECVEVNCSGLRGELLARELYGNARGAFTSADRDREGLLDLADHGTLFLDEIGDMSPEIQASFLKVLEEKCFRRLGDVRLRKSDFRLICATNRDINASVGNGQFRQDLFYRINFMSIHVPPLRERLDDLPRLATHILRNAGAADNILSIPLLRQLQAYAWPGNIRELKNVLERALLLAHGNRIQPEHLMGLDTAPASPAPETATLTGNIKTAERNHIMAVLARTGGNMVKAAKLLGISRATLYRKLQKEPD